MAADRAKRHETEIQALKWIITRCPKCNGLGVTKHAILSGTKLTKGRLENPERYEEGHEKAQEILRKKHVTKKDENPDNSSFGLCRCRIKQEALQEIITAELPRAMYDATPDDILPREASIIGVKKLDLQKLVGWYTKSLITAKSESIGLNFYGNYGRGKTWAVQYMAAQIAKKRWSVHYIPMFLILELIKNPENNLLREILEVDFLFIDDIGSEHPFRRESSGELSYFLRRRIAWRKPTSYVFNVIPKPEDIVTTYGPAFSSVCLERNINVHLAKKIVSEQQTKRVIRRFLEGV